MGLFFPYTYISSVLGKINQASWQPFSMYSSIFFLASYNESESDINSTTNSGQMGGYFSFSCSVNLFQVEKLIQDARGERKD